MYDLHCITKRIHGKFLLGHTHMHTQVKGLTNNAKCQPGGQLQAKLRKRFPLSEQSLVQTSGRSVFKWLSIRIPASVPDCNCLFFLWSTGWQYVTCFEAQMCFQNTDLWAGGLTLNGCWYSRLILCVKCENIAEKSYGRWLLQCVWIRTFLLFDIC